MATMFVKPAKEGIKIPNPKTGKFLKKDGEKVDKIKYWIRLLVREEIIEVSEKKKKKKIEKIEKGE